MDGSWPNDKHAGRSTEWRNDSLIFRVSCPKLALISWSNSLMLGIHPAISVCYHVSAIPQISKSLITSNKYSNILVSETASGAWCIKRTKSYFDSSHQHHVWCISWERIQCFPFCCQITDLTFALLANDIRTAGILYARIPRTHWIPDKSYEQFELIYGTSCCWYVSFADFFISCTK